ncbi:ASCH domain-containing protein [Niveibacterium sp. 24ML]|uniref:ASCH domain-containing protein n=1 Tax=Niveibacterium sp. 24ML TaxID=2985512 RepID=UPI00226FDAFC|nr:ASCH domain-containing protein [Niveibacterium sp. 24ML]MCX9157416.1 ASCH domain-containing protein [Niveibacterium sp. 24ML]
MDPLPTPEQIIAQLAAQGVRLPPGRVHVDGYGDSPALSQALLALIRDGQKRAGTGLLWGHEHEQLGWAEPGDIEVIVDHLNRPSVIARTLSVEIKAFCDVDAAYAATEGEGDGSLAYWREVHWDYFSRECARIGRTPSERMPVVCSIFEVLDVLPQAD